MDDRILEREAANQTQQLTDLAPKPPLDYENPAGLGGDNCGTMTDAKVIEPCDPGAAEDLVMEESKPGVGISGFEGEEVGGG